MDELVSRCLAKDPAQRPASVDEVARLLAAVELPRPWDQQRARRWWEGHMDPVTTADAGETIDALCTTLDPLSPEE